jgi:CBS domain-containing protein
LSRSRSYVKATKIAARIGGLFAFLMAIVGVVTFSVTLILVALFVYVAATTESKMVVYSDLYRSISISDIISRDGATIPVAASIEEVWDRMVKEGATSYPVTDTAGEIVGVVRLDDLKDREVASEAHIGDIMTTEIETVSAEADASEIPAQFGHGQDDRLFVEEEGEVADIITRDDFMTTLNILQGSECESVSGVPRI